MLTDMNYIAMELVGIYLLRIQWDLVMRSKTWKMEWCANHYYHYMSLFSHFATDDYNTHVFNIHLVKRTKINKYGHTCGGS